MSHQTFGSETPTFPGADKVAHLFIYTILASTIFYALKPEIKIKPALAMSLVIMITVLYGASDEFHQSFVPGRQPDLMDLVADAFGGLTASIGWYNLFGRKE